MHDAANNAMNSRAAQPDGAPVAPNAPDTVIETRSPAPPAHLKAPTSGQPPETQRAPLYLYGVCPRSSLDIWEAVDHRPLGLGDALVGLVEVGGLAAIVSAAPSGTLRPERRHLAAHQRVTQSIASLACLLPVAFGTVFKSRRPLIDVLRANQDELIAQIDRVDGCVEMGVRVRLEGVDPFAHFTENDAELRSLRALIAGGHADHETKVRAGRAFQRTLDHARASAGESVHRVLADHARELIDASLRTERDLVNVSCLVERSASAAFSHAAESLAASFDEHHTIDISGPWPPHSFVNVRLSPSGA